VSSSHPLASPIRELREGRVAGGCGLLIDSGMPYRVELMYSYGWDDACWTECSFGEERPLRFENIEQAEAAIVELLAPWSGDEACELQFAGGRSIFVKCF
jgi:hypothetical protein